MVSRIQSRDVSRPADTLHKAFYVQLQFLLALLSLYFLSYYFLSNIVAVRW